MLTGASVFVCFFSDVGVSELLRNYYGLTDWRRFPYLLPSLVAGGEDFCDALKAVP